MIAACFLNAKQRPKSYFAKWFSTKCLNADLNILEAGQYKMNVSYLHFLLFQLIHSTILLTYFHRKLKLLVPKVQIRLIMIYCKYLFFNFLNQN